MAGMGPATATPPSRSKVKKQKVRKNMRLVLILCGAATLALAQQPAEKTFTGAADVKTMIAKAKNERKPDQPNFVQPLLLADPYKVNLEYRVHGVDSNPNVHEDEAEIFYVIEGGGTLTTGGKLVNEKRLNPTNLTGTAIDGGTARTIAKGDFFLVPENTAHWFTKTDGTLVIMSVHVPRGGASASASK
jgi:mannose-6-phosphate isomerase-like protein (cupin superfamily)